MKQTRIVVGLVVDSKTLKQEFAGFNLNLEIGIITGNKIKK